MDEHTAEKGVVSERVAIAALVATGRHSGETARAALASAAERLAEYDRAPKCAHCGHVRGLHGRNHGCMSAFADGVAGQSCACSGYVIPPVKGES